MRCSALPRLVACPGSMKPGGLPNMDSKESTLGTKVHSILAAYITNGTLFELTEEEKPLVFGGVKVWDTLKLALSDVKVEPAGANGDLDLSGHADVVAKDEDGHTVILDWKTGNKTDFDYTAQLKGYALLFADAFPAKMITVWLRSGETDTIVMTEDEANAFTEQIFELPNNPDVFAAGQHCTDCPHRQECAVRDKYIAATANDLAPFTGDKSQLAYTPRQLAEMLPRVRMAEKMVDGFKKVLKDVLTENGGAIDLGDGKALKLVEKHRKAYQVAEATYTEMRIMKGD